MAEEQLTLVDGMSSSLRRIYQEAERLNKRMLSLKANIKSLEKPASMSYLRRELKETEKQAQQTERAIKAMKSAEALNTRYRAFTVGANGRYYVNGMQVSNANRAQMAENYIRNVANGQMRRNRLLWENGRLVNGMTFDQRLLARTSPFRARFGQFDTAMRNFGDKLNAVEGKFGRLTSSSGSLMDNFLRLSATVFFLSDVISRVGGIVKDTFIRPQSEYISNLTRVALTNDRKLLPTEMMNQLYDTASRTRAPADASMMLYNRIALSGVKADNERIRRFVESFNKVTAISGTTAQENKAVMLQLAQGIGSNRLGGDEFRSISEQAPLFKYMLAKGMGVNPGALKGMGAQGKLTAEAILSAMEKVQDEIDLIFKEAPLTIDQTITILQNKWQKLINDQFVGYIALRDLVKDIVTWMDTPQGKETISAIIKGWNNFMLKAVQLARQLAPFVLWMLKHLKQIAITVGSLIAISMVLKSVFVGFQMLIAGFRLYEWFISATEGAVLLRTALSGIGPVILSWLGPLAAVLAAIGLVVGGIMAVRKLNKEFDPNYIRQQQSDKNAYFRFEKDIDNYINQKYRMPTYLTAQGKEVKLSPEEQVKRAEIAEQRARAYQMKDYLIYQYNEAQKKGIHLQFRPEMMEPFALNGIKGMADSSKNVPMVGKVNEVGKVNDAISIDNDGIEMMKAIAERQWVMQNEVTVPQQVDVHISKEVDVSDERIAEAITGGTKIAVASSMRGAPA